MSAVPKKKLCWNCEGNVSKDIDNCPYCGVYLHATESEDDSDWNPSYRPSSKTEEIPSPLYQNREEVEKQESEETKRSETIPSLFTQLKKEIFPLLFLMAGSIFFLFGIVLLLFAQNSTLTLQWNEDYSLYFLFFAFPLLFFGWKYLQQSDSKD